MASTTFAHLAYDEVMSDSAEVVQRYPRRFETRGIDALKRPAAGMYRAVQ